MILSISILFLFFHQFVDLDCQRTEKNGLSKFVVDFDLAAVDEEKFWITSLSILRKVNDSFFLIVNIRLFDQVCWG